MEARIHHARKLLPNDKTEFLNEDSIQAIRLKKLPRSDYNFIHIDNSPGRFGDYCENFDLFPEIVDCLGNWGSLVFNVWLDVKDQHPDPVWLSRRKKFFGLSDTDDSARVNYETAERAYVAHIPQDRFSIRDVFPVPHYGETIYMVISLMRKIPRSPKFKEKVVQAAA